MAQKMSPPKLVLSLLLLWLVAYRYAEAMAMILEKMEPEPAHVNLCDSVAIKVDVNAGDEAADIADVAYVADVAEDTRSDLNDCFEIYFQESHNASHTYALAYKECYDLGIEKRLKLKLNQQPKREDVTVEMYEVCKTFRKCSELESDLDFYHCQKKNSNNNMNSLLDIYLKSSAAIVELDDQYQEAEKEVMLCIIAAGEQYRNSASKAYKRHRQCLNLNTS